MQNLPEFLTHRLFVEQKPVLCANLAKTFALSLKEAQNELKAYYSRNLEETQAFFVVTYVAEQRKLVNSLVSEEELANFLENEQKDRGLIVDCYLYALGPPNLERNSRNSLIFGCVAQENAYNIASLDDSFREFSLKSESSKANGSVIAKKLVENPLAKRENTAKKSAFPEDLQRNLPHPALKKLKTEEKKEIPKKSEQKPQNTGKMVGVPSKLAGVSSNLPGNSPKPSQIPVEKGKESEDECYYGEKAEEIKAIVNEDEEKPAVCEKNTKQTNKNEEKTEKPQVNNENICPESEKFEIVKKKRKIKKTIEEMNAKGQLVSRDIVVEEEYEEKVEIKPKNNKPAPMISNDNNKKAKVDTNQRTLK